MKVSTSTVTSKGQVTIPKDIRERLSLQQGDKLGFVVDDEGRVSLQPLRGLSLDEIAGIAGSLPRQTSWEEVKRIVQEDRAEHADQILR